MALAKYRLKGHESFILREGWITKALFAIDRDPLLFTVSAGADALGVGTNMAKSIRYWMRTAGLTDESQATGVHLTELGRTILQCDPYLEDIFTLWIIHINIATNYKLATSWNAGITCQTPAKTRLSGFSVEVSCVLSIENPQNRKENSPLSDREIPIIRKKHVESFRFFTYLVGKKAAFTAFVNAQ